MDNRQIIFKNHPVKSSEKLMRDFPAQVCYTNDKLTAQLVFEISDCTEAELAGLTASIMIFMKDGSFFQDSAVIDAPNKKITYVMLENQVAHAGDARASLVLTGGSQGWGGPDRNFTVISDLGQRVATEVMIKDWTMLTAEARAYLDEFAANEITRQQTAAAAESARAQTFTTNEAARQSNFEANEATRQDGEDTRLTAEQGRVTAEQGRATAETGRVNSESSRVTAEQGRTTAEQGRVSAESARVTAEQGRAAALAAKADKTYTDTELAKKADKAEIEAARGSEATLGARLDGLTQDYTQHKLEYVDLKGVNDGVVIPEKTSFFNIDKAINKFNPANQTDLAITKSSLIYSNGSITEYNEDYWVSAPIYLEGGKVYTMTNPVASDQDSTLLGAIFDITGNYVRGVSPTNYTVVGNSVTFDMPVNGAYIRTTVYGAKFSTPIAERLTAFNAQFMVVEGSTFPAYTPYYPTTYKIKSEHIEQPSTAFKPIFLSLNTDIINVISKYGTNTDLRVVIKKKGPNNIFDFYRWYKIGNPNTAPSTDIEAGVQFAENSSDFFGPFQVMVTTNADGDNKDVNGNYLPRFTGGNHSYNNTATAFTDRYKLYADGKEVSDGFNGYCNFIDIIWVNKVQAYNTTKIDGTGRVVLTEKIHLHFDGFEWSVENEITGLETIGFMFYYGLQAFVKNFSKTAVYFCGSRVNRFANNVGVGDVNSGDKNCVAIKSIGTTDTLEFGIDNTFDLGTFKNSIYDYSAHGGYEKCYFDLIEQTPSNKIILNVNDKMGYRGYYKFYPTI
ncbi:phage baseplate upper protein [Clostridiaceae bacterium HFYG-1003]|nr:phage baseplate upper protein [Clostridiaceae bacterium HFYG-1003]